MRSQTSSLELLAVSFVFPPTAAPRSVQVARLLKHLRVRTTLVCADDQDAPRDPTIEPNAETQLRDCLRVPFAMRGWRKQARRIASRFDLPVWNKIPDEYSSWKAQALRAIRKHVSNNDYRPDLTRFINAVYGLGATEQELRTVEDAVARREQAREQVFSSVPTGGDA